MKFLKTLCVTTALLNLGVAVQAQQSSGTDPIFVQRMPLLSGADTHVSISVDTVGIYRGTIDLSENGTLTLSHTPQWQNGELAADRPYLLVVLGGDLEGASFDIIANTAASVTIDAGNYDLSRLHEGSTVQIQPAWTLEDIASLGELPEGAEIMLLGQNQQTGAPRTLSFFLFDNFGWVDASLNPVANLHVERGEGFVVRLPAEVSGEELVAVGQVPLSSQRTVFAVSGQQQTTNYRFGMVGTESALLDEFDFGGDVEVYVYDNTAATVNKRPQNAYLFIEGWGWYDSDFNEVGSSATIEPGQAYMVRHYGNGQDSLRELLWMPSYLE